MALAVVGAGFRRTGTNSLKVALEMLTLGPCHHMFEVLNDLEQLPFWQADRATDEAAAGAWSTHTVFHQPIFTRSDRGLAFSRGIGEVAMATIAPERLLTYDVAEGWQPLCQFLGVPVPKDAFPRTNSTAEFQTRVIAR